MNVLYLVTGIRPPKASGSEFIQNLIFEISKKGVNATIISPIYIHTEKNMVLWVAEQERKYKVRFVLIDTPSFIKKIFLLHIAITPFLTTIAVLKILFRERFDIVHEFTSTPVIVIRSLIYRCFNTPSIFTLAVLNKTFLGRLFWFKIFDFGSAYLIPSHEMISTIEGTGVKKQKLFYLPPGVNISSFKSKTTKIQARKKLGLPSDLVVITYFGALTKEKGVYDIVHASNLLSKETQDKIFIAFFCYYLKGFSTFEKIAREIKNIAPKNLKLYENYVDIPQLLSASDYIIYPPHTGHGITIPPISILESLASQKPVIATDIIGIREVVTNENGILVPPANPPALAEAIKKVSKNIKFKLRSNLRNFDLNNVSDRLLLIYRQVSKTE